MATAGALLLSMSALQPLCYNTTSSFPCSPQLGYCDPSYITLTLGAQHNTASVAIAPNQLHLAQAHKMAITK